jgi:hypothetical protein
MALIPVGNAGFRVPGAAPTPRVDRQPSLGEGLAEVGRAGMQVADQMLRESARQLAEDTAAMQDERREQNAAIRQEIAEIRAERRRAAELDSAQRAEQARQAMQAAHDQVAEQFRAGDLDEVGFIGQFRSAIDDERQRALKGADPAFAPMIERALVGAEREVQRKAAGTVVAVTKDRRKAKVVELSELLQRDAVSDPAAAIVRNDALLDGEVGTLGQADVATRKATFREQAWRSHFTRAIEDNRDNPAALNALRGRISGTQALDPNQQTALLTSIDTRQTLLENRGRAAAEASDRRAQQAFTALQSLDAQGLPIDPGFLSATMARLKGTPLEEAARAIASGSAASAKFGSLSVREQDAVLADEYAKAAKAGVDPARSAHLAKLRGIRNASEAAYKADPWQAGVERGQIEPPAPLDLSDPNKAMESFTARMAQAPTIDRLAGRQVSPLKPDEARQLGDMLDRMPIPERTRFLGGIGKVIGGRRLEDLSRQLGAKNNELGIAAAMEAHQFRTQSGRSVAELYLEGADAIKTDRVKLGTTEAQTMRADVYDRIGDAYTSPAAREAAVDVAMKLWAREAVAGKSLSAGEAVRMSTGGIMEIAGHKTPMPYGWTEDEVRWAINRIDGAAIAAAAGTTAQPGAPLKGNETRVRVGDSLMTASELAAQIQSVQLRSAGSNRYVLQVGNQIVTREDRTPFTISLVKP